MTFFRLIVPSCNIICMFYFCWHRQSCTYSIQFVSLLVVCCQVKLVKNCSNIGQKLAKGWSKKLVKKVGQKSWSSWSKVGQKLVKSWSSLSKFGQVDQKLTNLVKLVKNWSSWSKVGQKLTNLVKLIKKKCQVGQKLVKLVKSWSSWSKN